MDSSNGHHPEQLGRYVPVEMPRDEELGPPEEIVAFERATDPYANMLPGISSIRAAETMADRAQSGKRSNRLIMAVSVFMLLVLLLPFVLTVINQLAHH